MPCVNGDCRARILIVKKCDMAYPMAQAGTTNPGACKPQKAGGIAATGHPTRRYVSAALTSSVTSNSTTIWSYAGSTWSGVSRMTAS